MRKALIALSLCTALAMAPQAHAAGYGIDPSGGAPPPQTQTQDASVSPLMALLSFLGLVPADQLDRGFGIDPEGRGAGIDPDGGNP